MACVTSELTLPATGTFPLGALYNARIGRVMESNFLKASAEVDNYPHPGIGVYYQEGSDAKELFNSLQAGADAQLKLMRLVRAGENALSYNSELESLTGGDSCVALFCRTSRVKRIAIGRMADKFDWNAARNSNATHVLVAAIEGCRGVIQLNTTSRNKTDQYKLNGQARIAIKQYFEMGAHGHWERRTANTSHDMALMVKIYGYNRPITSLQTVDGIPSFLLDTLPKILEDEDAKNSGYRPQLMHIFMPLCALGGCPADFNTDQRCRAPKYNVATATTARLLPISRWKHKPDVLFNGDLKNFAWFPLNDPANSLVVRFSQPYHVSSLIFLLCRDYDWYSYYVEVSDDNNTWNRVWDKSEEKCRDWQIVRFAPQCVVYVRIVGTRTGHNDGNFDVAHFECPIDEERLPQLLAS